MPDQGLGSPRLPIARPVEPRTTRSRRRERAPCAASSRSCCSAAPRSSPSTTGSGSAAGLDFAIDGPLYDAVVLGAGLACLVRALGRRRERAAWIADRRRDPLLGRRRGLLDRRDRRQPLAPYPSPADIGYLAFYPLADAGPGLLVRARAHELNWRLWMDGLIAALGTAALGAAFVFDFVADQTTGTPLQVATTLAYPLGDIVDARAGRRRRRPHPLAPRPHLVAAAGRPRGAGRSPTSPTRCSRPTPALPGGDWIDPIYLIAAVCLGAAAWQPAEAAEISRRRAATAGAS